MTASAASMIERSSIIRASRGRVWQALTNLQEFCKWFGAQAEGEFKPGARMRMISTGNCGAGEEFFLDVVKMEPPAFFSWLWHPGRKEHDVDYSQQPMTLVEFHLTEVEGGTQVTVKETGFDQLSVARRTRVFECNDGRLGAPTDLAHSICKPSSLARN